ncbi:hypothetical protein AVEN_272381-1 [Araneus ventricosus]|uniref:Uncharacterized protein n=1 Tax=Araneus ventricosus TaxID=182803 RepID=A0A4Y2I0L5_ARAVE|nr:hypothetical protein AVEN_272381-1 [Araneus ventricosus]
MNLHNLSTQISSPILRFMHLRRSGFSNSLRNIKSSSWHFSTPSSANLLLWDKGILENARSSSKFNNLLKFLLEYDSLIDLLTAYLASWKFVCFLLHPAIFTS